MSILRNSLRQLAHTGNAWLKVDTAYILRGGFWSTVSFVVGTAASLATMVTFGNLISKDAYGTYNYLISLASSLGFLTLSGVTYGIVHAITKGDENVIPYAIRLQLRYGLLSTLIIGSVGVYYGAKGNMVFAAALILLAFIIPISNAYHSFEPILNGQKRFATLSIITSLTAIISAGATVITLYLTNSVLILICVYSTLSVLPNAFAYWYASRKLDKSSPSQEAIGRLRNTTFHITGAGMIGTIAQYIDKIILFQFAGPVALAVYGFAVAGPDRAKGFIKNWISIVLPRLSIRTIDEISAVLYLRILILTALGAAIAFICILAAPLLFHIFLPKYLEAIRYAQVYSLGLIFVPATIYIGNIFAGQNMLRSIYIHNLTSHLTKIILFPIFVSLWQIWGLIYASVLTYFLIAFYSIVILKIESKKLSNAAHE